MRYGFINNFSQTLAAELAAGATTMTLDGGGALLSAASADLVYALTLDDGQGTTEIVHVTGQTANELTVVRAQEGTTAAIWPTGSAVEMRVTAGVMGSLGPDLREMDNIVGGAGQPSDAQLALVSADVIGGMQGSVILGVNSSVYEDAAANTVDGAIAIGADQTLAGSTGFGTVLIGSNSRIYGDWGAVAPLDMVVVGSGTTVDGGEGQAVFVGDSAYGDATGVVCIGQGTSGRSENGVIIGRWAGSSLPRVTMLGAQSFCSGADAVMAGFDQSVSGAGSLTLGNYASNSISGGFVAHGVSYLRKASDAPTGYTGESARYRSAQQVALRSDTVDLASAANEFELTLPSGVALFIDAVDIVAATAVSGTPQVSAGTTSSGANIVAATANTIGAQWSRETHASSMLAGITGSIFFNVEATGTGSVYFIVKGYLIET